MIMQNLFPKYIKRAGPEERIRALTLSVRQNRQSQVILLYGGGGVGKSFLLRNLSDTIRLEDVRLLGPIDVDDLEFWSLTNLERYLCELIPDNNYFQDYKEHISQLPKFERERVGHETALAHLRKGDDIFVRCYQQFIQSGNHTPIIIFDTLEAIRGTDFLKKLLIWMKHLPGTLFILAGRPIQPGQIDPIITELDEDPRLPYEQIFLGEFNREESLAYIDASGVASGLTDEEKGRLALMSQGHPLWLSLAVYYLDSLGLPEEIEKLSLTASEQPWPYRNGALHDAFIRRLVVPYRERDYLHEAVLRLGVVRQRLNKELWCALMADEGLPEGVSNWDEAWEMFLKLPWIRTRANRQYVTLQDALAEELAKRIIPLQDYDMSWRKSLWEKTIKIYTEAIARLQQELDEKRKILDEALKNAKPGERHDDLMNDVLQIDNRSLELFLLQTTRLYYQMLVDHEEGCRQFISLFDPAARDHQYRFIEVLWSEMQRFLSGEQVYDTLEDIIKPEVTRFQQWYQGKPAIQYEIITRIARYLYDIGQAAESEEHLNDLWDICKGNLEWEYTILNLRANARLRFSGLVKDALDDFEQALERTRRNDAPPTIRAQEGQALNELGYYHRNTGNWSGAAKSYLEALKITHLEALEKKAGIQAQYAYVQALRGLYQDARDLIDSALKVRRWLKLRREVGMALSVKGEVWRYGRDYPRAWEAYRESELIFEEFDDWGWLGLVRQEMAICLHQAGRAGVKLSGFTNPQDMLGKARELILIALDYCREYSRRSYPSALNRAGRIIGWGFGEYEKGLGFLEEGIREGEAVADGWFWFANLVEYVELSYHAWQESGEDRYQKAIEEKTGAIEKLKKEYEFPDLRGRWELLQGQLKANEAEAMPQNAERERMLYEALGHFKQGYPLIGLGYIGSHGVVALADEFSKLEEVMKKLGEETRKEWFRNLEEGWSKLTPGLIDKERQEASLLALLTDLYMKFLTNSKEG